VVFVVVIWRNEVVGVASMKVLDRGVLGWIKGEGM